MKICANGIDVSEHQGTIDWKKVKASGVGFAMLRAGFGRYKYQIDAQFESNVQGAEAAGVPWGAYWYSYAKTADEARAEAKVCLEVLKGKKPEYPVAFDIEDASQAGLSKKTVTEIAKAFCAEIENAGYYASIYTFLAWANSKLDWSKLPYDFWLAQWSGRPTFTGAYGMWQYTDAGTVDGVSGRIDRNCAYKDYPKLIRAAGLNGYGPKDTEPQETKKTVDALANEVIAGKWGNGADREKRLTAAGYDYNAVQSWVNEMLLGKEPAKKSLESVADEVIAGKWGNGETRARRLAEAGYEYDAVQQIVNRKLLG